MVNAKNKIESMQDDIDYKFNGLEILDEQPEITDRANTLTLKNPRGVLEFDNVDFAYKDGENGPDWVLKDIDLKVKPGEKVALVGFTKT